MLHVASTAARIATCVPDGDDDAAADVLLLHLLFDQTAQCGDVVQGATGGPCGFYAANLLSIFGNLCDFDGSGDAPLATGLVPTLIHVARCSHD